MRTRKVVVAVMIVIALVTGLVAVSGVAAFADAGSHASCMGHEVSSIAPAGTTDEFPGGVHQFTQVIRELFPGVPSGVIYSTIARLHEGSHEACDEALE
jgi:hypothetical protein